MKLILTMISLAVLYVFFNTAKKLFGKDYIQKPVNFLTCGLFFSSLIMLFISGIPFCFHELPPLHYILVFTLAAAVFTYSPKLAILGNVLLDNLVLAVLVISAAYAIANGIIAIFSNGVTMNLFWTWLILSCGLAFLLRVAHWVVVT